MLNRWFHRPLLHSPALGLEKKATWLELFFDLIFVAAFIQLGNILSDSVTLERFSALAGVFLPLWLSWIGFTFFCNRFTLDDFIQRSCVFIQMFAVGGMAISAHSAVVHGKLDNFALFAAVSQLMVAVMYYRAFKQVPESADYSKYWGRTFLISGLLWAVSALAPPAVAVIMWALATFAVLGAPFSKQSRILSDRYPIDFEHLGERFGLLTLIVLGESFVKVLSTLVASDAGLSLYFDAGVILLLTGGVWWVYFDDVAGARIRKGPGLWLAWLYAHIPLQLAIIALGVAVKKAVIFSWDGPAPASYRWLLAGTLAIIYVSVAIIDSVTERKQAELSDRARVNARAGSGLLLLVLAPAGGSMSGGLFLTLIVAINVGHVLFDMMMVPFEHNEHAERGMRTTAELARENLAHGEKRGIRVRNFDEVVRKGAPSEMRSDMYFFFIRGSWIRLAAAFSFMFVLTNVFFAALYTLEADGITGTRPDSFADAFYFSVQTMSTIGFGNMSPVTGYSNAIVTLEAAVSIILVAVSTGLVFAKISRPRAGALFSRPMILTELHGQKNLIFRVGNARGNEVVDASLTVTVTMEELSPEGHHLRRLHDLELVRARSPMFLLSWTVMHVIDEHSPLASIDWTDPSSKVGTIVVTLIGHDGTYGQTIYARHSYHASDIRVGHRFVDTIHELEDGRLMIDYSKFHDTYPEAEAESQPGRATSESE